MSETLERELKELVSAVNNLSGLAVVPGRVRVSSCSSLLFRDSSCNRLEWNAVYGGRSCLCLSFRRYINLEILIPSHQQLPGGEWRPVRRCRKWPADEFPAECFRPLLTAGYTIITAGLFDLTLDRILRLPRRPCNARTIKPKCRNFILDSNRRRARVCEYRKIAPTASLTAKCRMTIRVSL